MKPLVDKTSIHGFDQIHRSMRFGRVVLSLLVLAGLAIFGWFIFDLAVSYYEQHPNSSLEFQAFEYPPFALNVMGEKSIGFGKGNYHTIEGVNSSKATLDFVKMYFDMHNTYDGEDWYLKEWNFKNHDIVNELLDKASQRPEDFIHIQGKIPASIRNLYTPYRGIKYVIEANGTGENIKANNMTIVLSKCPMWFNLFAGSDAMSMSAPTAEQMKCGNDYKVYVSIRKFIWGNAFCNFKLRKYKGNCYATCAVENSLEGGCSEYLGSVVSGQNTPVCMTESDLANGRDRGEMKIAACDDTCIKCDVCATPCEEFSIKMTYKMKSGNQGEAQVQLLFGDVRQMMAVYTSNKSIHFMLLSSIGGMLGLCVVASFLSLVLHRLYVLYTCFACWVACSVRRIYNAEDDLDPEVKTV